MSVSPKEIQENRKRWLEALRGGEYFQAQGSLCVYELDAPTRYCCMGVACDVLDPGGWDYDFVEHRDCSNYPHPDICEKLGLTGDDCHKIGSWNDDLEWSFEEIAEELEGEMFK